MNRKNAPLSQQRGFTMVELMIAVVIIGMLAAFLTPSVSRYMERNMGRSTANDVASVMRMARNKAMSSGQVVFVEVEPGGAASNGTLSIYQRRPAGCDVVNPPTSCFSQSCTEASTFSVQTDLMVPEADIENRHPDMKIAGYNSNGTTFEKSDTATFCFTPNGRVLDDSGQPFSADCDGVNARVFVQPIDPGTATNPLGGEALDTCLSSTDGTVPTGRQLQKDGRDVANFFVIQIPFNGSISVVQ